MGTQRRLPSETEEIELKLAAGRRAFQAVLKSLSTRYGFRVDARVTQRLHDLYCDSADWWLYRAGVALRLRTIRNRIRLTLKTLRSTQSNLAHRLELEEPGPGKLSSTSFIPHGLIRAFIRRCGGPVKVRPLFGLDTTRTAVICRKETNHQLLVCLDRCVLTLGGGMRQSAARPFEEVEIEHFRGPTEETEVLLRKLAAHVALPRSPCSKFERGLHALGLTPLKEPASAQQPLAQPHDRLVDMAFRVLTAYWARMLEHEPGTRLGVDPEHLHQMRVAVRELRTAFGILKAGLPRVPTQKLDQELRWLGQALGNVRDLDAQRSLLSEKLGDNLKKGETAAYARSFFLKREEARRKLLAVLNSFRYRSLLRRFARFLERGSEMASIGQRALQPIAEAGDQLIAEAYRKVLKRGRKALRQTDATRLHRLRIACKRLRYVCEWFEAKAPKRLGRTILALVRLQDLLGQHHDAVVAAEYLHRTIRVAQIRRFRSSLNSLRQRIRESERKFPRAWRKFLRKSESLATCPLRDHL